MVKQKLNNFRNLQHTTLNLFQTSKLLEYIYINSLGSSVEGHPKFFSFA